MEATSLAAVTLAAHANAAAAAGHPLRLPAHPAFIAVRRARFRDGGAAGDIAAWFAHTVADAPLRLDDPGLGGPARLAGATRDWLLAAEAGGLILSAAAPGVDAATAALATAAGAAATPAAPDAWLATAERAAAILQSDGTGEELSDVAWPHFLLPASAPLAARRLAAAAATLWCWDQPGAWAGADAEKVRYHLTPTVRAALMAAVAATIP